MLTPEDRERLRGRLSTADHAGAGGPPDAVICGDAFRVLPRLPANSYDLLFADPPYNMAKKFGSERAKKVSDEDYEAWLDSWLRLCVPLLKETASVYICGDWRSGAAIQRAASRHFTLRNRIT